MILVDISNLLLEMKIKYNSLVKLDHKFKILMNVETLKFNIFHIKQEA